MLLSQNAKLDNQSNLAVMRTVINVGLCLGLAAIALVLLFFAYNVIWSIPDAQLTKLRKRQYLCWVAVVLGVVIFFLYPRNWDNKDQNKPKPVADSSLGAANPPNALGTTVNKAEAIDQWASFSNVAQDVITKNSLHLDNATSAKQYSIRCLDATSSAKQISTNGVNESIVVVTGQYKLTVANHGSGQSWSKIFSVSETIFQNEFQGLDSNTTKLLLANSLRETISNDKDALNILKETSK